MVSMRLFRAGLLLRATGLDGAPDGADLRRSDLLLVGGPPMRLDAADHLLPAAPRDPAAAARDLHQHALEPTRWTRTMLCSSWRSPKTSRWRSSCAVARRSCSSADAGWNRRAAARSTRSTPPPA